LRQRQAHFRGKAVSLFRPIDFDNQAMTLSYDVNTTQIGLLLFQGVLL
jgi:hypothetical protein